MELRIDKVYDKNGNELSKDFILSKFEELENFLTNTLKSKKYRTA